MKIDDIGPIALSIGTAIIITAVISMIISQFTPSTYENNSYNKTFDNVTTIYNHRGIQTMLVYNTTTKTYPALPATNYSYTSSNGTLLITDTNAGRYGTEAVWWSVNEDGNATYVVTKGLIALTSFADWFSIIIIVVISVIILAIVMLLRGHGGSE